MAIRGINYKINYNHLTSLASLTTQVSVQRARRHNSVSEQSGFPVLIRQAADAERSANDFLPKFSEDLQDRIVH